MANGVRERALPAVATEQRACRGRLKKGKFTPHPFRKRHTRKSLHVQQAPSNSFEREKDEPT